MNKLDIATVVAIVMTTVVVYALGSLPFIPAWAVFISWACFFHMDGGENLDQAYLATLQHVGVGILAAWLSVLLVLNDPFNNALTSEWWAPVVIGLIIGVLSRMSVLARFSITPAIIYGYAGTFAFLNSPGRFSNEALLSLTFDNALIALGISLVFGASAGYLNAILVGWLSYMSLRRG
ncbi:MAG TPA: DUF1097 domain-containing protein [Methylophilaceae bacterium]|nr:DUF1097 domain-containing protein [Methylophilaceae bacterium]